MPFQVLSPDGFTIHQTKVYKTRKEAIKAAKEWIQSFSGQGFYSYRMQRISLSDALELCEIIEVPDFEEKAEEDLVGEENPQF